MSQQNDLRENLFSVEPISPERRRRFLSELGQVLEPSLPRSHRLYYGAALIGSVVGIVSAACGLAGNAPHREMQALLLLVWAGSGGWIVYILRRGAEPLRAMQGLSKALAGVTAFGGVFVTLYGIENPSLSAVLWALLALLVFVLMSFINLWNRVVMTERVMRENILRVEYRVADLSARLSRDSTELNKDA